jgi:hypothetical protein
VRIDRQVDLRIKQGLVNDPLRCSTSIGRSGDVLNWYSRSGLVPGRIYVDADGRQVLEYSGIMPAAVARALTDVATDLLEPTPDGEPVLVFEVVAPNRTSGMFYTHTRSDADRGYGFIELVEVDGSPDHA